MQSIKDISFETLSEKILGKGFPPHLTGAVALTELSPDAQGFIIRMLDLMKRSRYSIAQFNPVLIRWLSTTIPSILPNAWGGQIPPITVSGRHKKLDDYIVKQNFPCNKEQNIFIDVGCGFPPMTTIDTARRLPEWQVYGVDRSFADYVLYDSKGHYACFNQAGKFLYFQTSMNSDSKPVYADPRGTINRFKVLFQDLLPLLQNTVSQSCETAEKNGAKLIRNHAMDFETANFNFIKSDMMDLPPMKAQVIRCMNLFLYFAHNTRKESLHHIKNHLLHNGLLIIGTNGLGAQSRYTVYRKKYDELILHEFAFSLDNLSHISLIPWFTIHEKDPEAMLLAQLAGTIRSNRSFWTGFSEAIDQLLEHHGLCKRKIDGFLYFPKTMMLPKEFLKTNAMLWQDMKEKGYLKDVVDILTNAGYDAWINPVDDIAIRPPGQSITQSL